MGVEITNTGVSTCGNSPMATIFVIILGSIVVLLGICFGFRKSRIGMPLAGSCSAAIRAAFHPPEADVGDRQKEDDSCIQIFPYSPSSMHSCVCP